MAYGDKKEEAIPLSPFPIANPVVYHFHPVAFVEQMRRMGGCFCYEPITEKELKLIFPNIKEVTKVEVPKIINLIFEKFEINTCLRKAHFFAQILEESGSALEIGTGENLNYSAIVLKDGEYLDGTWVNGVLEDGTPGYYSGGSKWKSGLFSYFKNRHDEADLYGRKDLYARLDHGIQVADQEAIANRAYSNKNGNGSITSSDGWKYRGKGMIQLTGKGNYISVNEKIQEKYSESEINILDNPECILTYREL
jgi:predicted chitinase